MFFSSNHHSECQQQGGFMKEENYPQIWMQHAVAHGKHLIDSG